LRSDQTSRPGQQRGRLFFSLSAGVRDEQGHYARPLPPLRVLGVPRPPHQRRAKAWFNSPFMPGGRFGAGGSLCIFWPKLFCRLFFSVLGQVGHYPRTGPEVLQPAPLLRDPSPSVALLCLDSCLLATACLRSSYAAPATRTGAGFSPAGTVRYHRALRRTNCKRKNYGVLGAATTRKAPSSFNHGVSGCKAFHFGGQLSGRLTCAPSDLRSSVCCCWLEHAQPANPSRPRPRTRRTGRA